MYQDITARGDAGSHRHLIPDLLRAPLTDVIRKFFVAGDVGGGGAANPSRLGRHNASRVTTILKRREHFIVSRVLGIVIDTRSLEREWLSTR